MRLLRVLFFLLLLLLLSAEVQAQPAIVQTCPGQVVTATSITVTCGSALTSGNLLACCYGSRGDTGPTMPAGFDTTVVAANTSNNDYVRIPWLIIPEGMSNAIQFTGLDAAGGTGLECHEVSGITSIPLDDWSVTSGAGGFVDSNTIPVGTSTASTSSSWAFACAYARNDITSVSWDSGFTTVTPRLLAGSNTEVVNGWKVLSATGDVSPIYGGGGTFTPNPTRAMGAFAIFKAGAPDTTAPSDPSNVSVTVTGSSTLVPTWTASTDDVGVQLYSVERCSGSGCTDFVVIGTTATTSYSDTGLTANTVYRYRISAYDLVNYSGYSSIAQATTLITQTVNLTWADTNTSPNEDGYRIQRATGPTGEFGDLADTTADAESYSDTSSPTSTTGQSACYRLLAFKSGAIDSIYGNTACTQAVIASQVGSKAVGLSLSGGSLH